MKNSIVKSLVLSLEDLNKFVLASRISYIVNSEREPMYDPPDDLNVGKFNYRLTDIEDDKIEYTSKDNPEFDVLVLTERRKILIMQYTYELWEKEFNSKQIKQVFKLGFELAKGFLKNNNVNNYNDYITLFESWKKDHDVGEKVLEDAGRVREKAMEKLVKKSDFIGEWNDYKIVSDTY